MAVRNGKKIKFKFKWTKELIALIVILVAMIVAVVIMAQPSEQYKIYKSYLAAKGENDTALVEDHVYDELSYKTLLTKIEKNRSDVIYVFYGTTSNADSVTNVQIINQAAIANKVDKVYYLDADFIDKLENKDDYDVKTDIESKGEALCNVDLLTYPSLWAFKDGKIVFNSQDYMDKDSETYNATWNFIASQCFGGEY